MRNKRFVMIAVIICFAVIGISAAVYAIATNYPQKRQETNMFDIGDADVEYTVEKNISSEGEAIIGLIPVYPEDDLLFSRR